MRTIIDAAGFEAKFQENIDPWNYAASPFEAYKRRALLRAAGDRIYGRALELACANGETTRALAPQCLRLLAVDASPTVLKGARNASKGYNRVTFRLALLPRATPRGPFDLIVASEIFYYLKPGDLRRLLPKLYRSLAPGGRLVVLHHIRDFDDAAILPRIAQRQAFKTFQKNMNLVTYKQTAAFQVAAFEKKR
ncbi:class I SAM-dependent methyltransferase [Oryzicola mucosus]|uniref:Methyltransferase domain-containing protein n=1 Tax=Oryzicola mucosus TaxID=2767425 RepID=A0A8J6U7Z2_9HYPH|nr:class I SAM-dependent methyltransferase [Oryzicola mucosus]MBD0415272.1 methyltransferase domain-containing protein [Oryzicola mucosus]